MSDAYSQAADDRDADEDAAEKMYGHLSDEELIAEGTAMREAQIKAQRDFADARKRLTEIADRRDMIETDLLRRARLK